MDGVRVDREDGWFLIRASGTQPLVRLTAEARAQAAATELLREAEEVVNAAKAGSS
jgi:phosphoglucosamine mutase